MTTTAEQTSEQIRADALRPAELAELQECVRHVQSGELQYYVELTNRKQTKSKKRLPGEHYDPDPALRPHAHRGWLVAAPTNLQDEVYLHIYDEARAKVQGENFGHTRVTLRGLRSFKALTDPRTGERITRPGPLGSPASTGPGQTPPFAGQSFPAFSPQMLMAWAMFMQGQALAMMAQAMQDHARPTTPPS